MSVSFEAEQLARGSFVAKPVSLREDTMSPAEMKLARGEGIRAGW